MVRDSAAKKLDRIIHLTPAFFSGQSERHFVNQLTVQRKSSTENADYHERDYYDRLECCIGEIDAADNSEVDEDHVYRSKA
jgi:hypothetical protein